MRTMVWKGTPAGAQPAAGRGLDQHAGAADGPGRGRKNRLIFHRFKTAIGWKAMTGADFQSMMRENSMSITIVVKAR